MTRLSDLDPARPEIGERTPVPGTDLVVELHGHRYRRGRTPDGSPTVVKWAELTFTGSDGEAASDRYPLDETHEILGHRLYITGTRSSVVVYGLPPLESDRT